MARSPYLVFEPKRVLASVAIAAVLVPALAYAIKFAIEIPTDLTYELHWTSTMPVIFVVFAGIINGTLNIRAGVGQDGS
jgi:predicted Na+-dependent transporter